MCACVCVAYALRMRCLCGGEVVLPEQHSEDHYQQKQRVQAKRDGLLAPDVLVQSSSVCDYNFSCLSVKHVRKVLNKNKEIKINKQ